MHGMFRANGGCGYVKKPDFLMDVDRDGKVFDPTATLPVKKTLKVSINAHGWIIKLLSVLLLNSMFLALNR